MPTQVSLSARQDPSLSESAYSLWVTIPRTEEVHELNVLGKGGARTVFVLQVHCKGSGAVGSPGVGAGSTQTWLLKKRYGYFERIHRFASKCAASAGEPSPMLPRRKLLGHRDPKYLHTLREELQAYLERVIDIARRTTASSMSLTSLLQHLELPVATDSVTWEQRSRFGAAADGRSLPVEIEGLLRKQGGSKSDVKRRWRERWFVLTGSSLHYYANPEAPSTKGTIELHAATVVEADLGEEAFGIVLHLADRARQTLSNAWPNARPNARPNAWPNEPPNELTNEQPSAPRATCHAASRCVHAESPRASQPR